MGTAAQPMTVCNRELLTGRDKENHRLRIQLGLDVKFDDLTSEIRRDIGPVDIWAIPIRQGDLPPGEHLLIKTEVRGQFLLLHRALYPLNERLRDYVWQGVC